MNDGESHAGKAAPIRRSGASGGRGEAIRFLAVGGVSFLIDLGLLVLLREVFNVPLVIATAAAFLISLIANYLLQRLYAFRATSQIGASAVKYLALVVFNTAATSLIVLAFEKMGLGYQIGKIFSTAVMTVWNFYLYRHWIFRRVDR